MLASMYFLQRICPPISFNWSKYVLLSSFSVLMPLPPLLWFTSLWSATLAQVWVLSCAGIFSWCPFLRGDTPISPQSIKSWMVWGFNFCLWGQIGEIVWFLQTTTTPYPGISLFSLCLLLKSSVVANLIALLYFLLDLPQAAFAIKFSWMISVNVHFLYQFIALLIAFLLHYFGSDSSASFLVQKEEREVLLPF